MTEHNYDDKEGEHQVYGPPGTGKTTFLVRQINLAAQKYGSKNILVASFTTAAAAELVRRDLAIGKEQSATLHAHAYRALGKPKILETDKDLIAEWNKQNTHLRIGKSGADLDNPHDDGEMNDDTPGNELLAKYQLMRAKQVTTFTSPAVMDFAARWEEFKRVTKSIDYTDMIGLALDNVAVAPGSPNVMFIDEAQDLTALEWALVRQWGRYAEKLIVSGDDDQCIYGFKGASAEKFYGEDLPEGNKHILKQSYRVPQAVHRIAEKWVSLLSQRQPKEYRPRVDEEGNPVEGHVRWLPNVNYKEPLALIKDMEFYLKNGKTVMILTACGYMLQDIKAALRGAGLPFHNPYRKKRGDWNPLGRGSSTKALLSYLAPMLHGWKVSNSAEDWKRMLDAKLWSKEELDSWLHVMSISTFLKRGYGKELEESMEAPSSYDLSQMLTEPEKFIDMVNGNLDWFTAHLQKANKAKFEYLCTIVEKHRPQALNMVPPITIGTIHSVKGGEADIVYLMPDLAQRAYQNWAIVEHRDETIRQFYVGMTRCKEGLVLTAPASGSYIKGLNKFLTE